MKIDEADNLNQLKHMCTHCTHCGGTRQTKTRCYEFIGYPEWCDPAKALRKRNSKNPRASVAAADPSTKASTKSSHKARASIAVAKPSEIGKTLYTFSHIGNNTCIIHTGATDHMTFDANNVKSLNPSSQHILSKANGNSTPVLGEGLITLTKTMNLDFVLVVPTLNHNLLSIAQITNTLQYIIIFWPNVCF